jgi:hypothetical protein
MKKYFFMLLCLIVFSGCGANGGSPPPGTPVAVLLERPTVTNDGALSPNDRQNLQVTVGTASVPVIDAKVTLTGGFTVAPTAAMLTAAGLNLSDVVKLCDGTPLVDNSGGESQITLPTTNDLGQTSACIQFADGGGLAYTFQFTAYSGSGSDTATLAVQ